MVYTHIIFLILSFFFTYLFYLIALILVEVKDENDYFIFFSIIRKLKYELFYFTLFYFIISKKGIFRKNQRKITKNQRRIINQSNEKTACQRKIEKEDFRSNWKSC